MFVGLNNGRVAVINWPLVQSKPVVRYDVFLTTSPITTLAMLYLSRFLAVGADDGTIFMLEPYHIVDGRERIWLQENTDH